VPLTHAVQNGDRVEILTAKQPGPSRDWLNPRLGYIHGARARGKVRQWFKKEGHDDNLRAGREAIESEARRMGLTIADLPADLAPVIKRFGLGTASDLLVAVGSGDLTVGQVVSALSRFRSDQVQPQAADLLTRTPARQRTQPAKGRTKSPSVRRQPDDHDCEMLPAGPGDPVAVTSPAAAA